MDRRDRGGGLQPKLGSGTSGVAGRLAKNDCIDAKLLTRFPDRVEKFRSNRVAPSGLHAGWRLLAVGLLATTAARLWESQAARCIFKPVPEIGG